MTQQRTYAHHVRKVLGTFETSPVSTLTSWAARELDNAQHFVLPYGGRVLNDKLKGLQGVDSQLLRLPYPKITLSFQVPNDSMETLIFYFEQEGEIRFLTFMNVPGWGMLPFLGSIEHISVSTDVLTSKNGLRNLSDARMSKEEYDEFFWSAVSVLAEFLEALSCKNVTHEPLPVSKVGKLLSRNKNLPDYETRILVINTSKGTSDSCKSSGGTHASPRQHLRRGHIRRLDSGNIWINSCVVGSEGNICKEYHVL